MLTVETKGSRLTVTINRPEVRNALSDATIRELKQLFETLPDTVRVVVLTGAGSAFCAGGDLEWMRRAAGYTQAQNEADALELARLFDAIATCRPFVLARVNGHAFGGGCGLVAACDAAVASEKALFSFSEVKLGLIPATIARHVIPKIGIGQARAYFASGAVFDAAASLRMGLVHQVTDADGLDAAVDSWIGALAKAGPEAVHRAKLLAQQPQKTPEDGARLLAEVRSGDEAREGIAAFLEKRSPSFAQEDL